MRWTQSQNVHKKSNREKYLKYRWEFVNTNKWQNAPTDLMKNTIMSVNFPLDSNLNENF